MYVSRGLEHTRIEDDCLVWTRCLNSDGYPRAVVRGNSNGKVHREVFSDTNGYYPDVVRHTCDNRRCLNPAHLVAGDSLDNVKDRVNRGRTFNHVTPSEYNTCLTLKTRGLIYRAIAETLNVKTKRVEYILTRWRKES